MNARILSNRIGPSTPASSGVPPTMAAIVQRRYGSTDALQLTADAETPAPGDHEVLVEVRAAAVDRATWHLMAGQPYVLRAAFGLRWPKMPIPGGSVSGVVAQVGHSVERFAVGDRVFGFAQGAYAEYAVGAESKLALVPDDLAFASAASVPDSGVTALQAVTEVAHVAAGDSVLIIGASGGVGSFATQVAVGIGAHVTGVCSTAKIDFVLALGAARVIDYEHETIESDGTTFDVVIDIGGNTSLRRLRRVMKEDGTLVIVGGEGGGKWIGGTDRQLRALALSPFVKQRLTTFIATEHLSGLDRLAEMIATGAVVPAVTRRFALSDVPQAIDDLVAGRIAGKAVIIVGGVEADVS